MRDLTTFVVLCLALTGAGVLVAAEADTPPPISGPGLRLPDDPRLCSAERAAPQRPLRSPT